MVLVLERPGLRFCGARPIHLEDSPAAPASREAFRVTAGAPKHGYCRGGQKLGSIRNEAKQQRSNGELARQDDPAAERKETQRSEQEVEEEEERHKEKDTNKHSKNV